MDKKEDNGNRAVALSYSSRLIGGKKSFRNLKLLKMNRKYRLYIFGPSIFIYTCKYIVYKSAL